MRARRVHHCRECGRETPQEYAGCERGDRETEFYRCVPCGLLLVTYADVLDAEGFAITIAARWISKQGTFVYEDVRSIEAEEVVAQARVELWAAYLAWSPTRGVRFRAYASTRVPQRLTDWIRQQNGRTTSWRDGAERPAKAHARAVSLDAPVRPGERRGAGAAPGGGAVDHPEFVGDRLDATLGSGARDPAESRSPDLARVLERRGRGIAREERALGLCPAA